VTAKKRKTKYLFKAIYDGRSKLRQFKKSQSGIVWGDRHKKVFLTVLFNFNRVFVNRWRNKLSTNWFQRHLHVTKNKSHFKLIKTIFVFISARCAFETRSFSFSPWHFDSTLITLPFGSSTQCTMWWWFYGWLKCEILISSQNCFTANVFMRLHLRGQSVTVSEIERLLTIRGKSRRIKAD
jgi:hypothetical protein